MTRRVYPSRKRIEQALELARRAGLTPTAFEIKPDGTIRVISGPAQAEPKEDWETAWNAA